MAWDWDRETRNALAEFLTSRGIVSGPITTQAIGDGHSNLTFLVSDDTTSVVVRRPPPPPIPPGANDMLREATLLHALSATEVPVPEVLAVAQEGEVLDVPLYVMSFAPGPVVTIRTPPPLDTPEHRRAVGYSMIDTLADLHGVDWRAVGLDRMGRPEGFNARHLQRMRRLVADDEGNPPAEFADVDAWLQANIPPESGATLIHCDFRIGNVVLAPTTPGRVAAVLDWELATIGDPLLDVGYLLATVPEPGRPMNPTAQLSAAMLEPGYPSKDQLAQRYSARTGRDLDTLAWYTTLALWKLAVLYEYSRRRVLDGIGDPYYSDPALVRSFLDDARRAAGLAGVSAEV
ncbi:phosphotransferase family protein [Nocardia nova]|uniref:Putative aminoglycoside phosphotransferase n=1 Tax=Nocardia cerradoensis TaxID=85688 RepID=A0A231GXI9_9NOCA|nr:MULTISPECIES: phosphotransferase family protein [Nocardia]OXR41316.1 putative aminoglycoside phosphotransferase [Nocardia cerradoensis]PPJ12252.1 phosphotransferase family protein [Nocardia nova]PPJ14943.1 phosphotransferase family protein [Nocardia nova]